LYELSCLYSKNPGAAAAETHDRLPRSMRKAADWRGSSSFCAVSGRSLFLRLILWRLILASQRQAFGRTVFGRADLHVAAVMTDSEDRPLADALVRQRGRHDDAGMPIGNDLMDLEAALDEPAAEPHLLDTGTGAERHMQACDLARFLSFESHDGAVGIFGRCQLAHRDERGDVLGRRRPCPRARIRRERPDEAFDRADRVGDVGSVLAVAVAAARAIEQRIGVADHAVDDRDRIAGIDARRGVRITRLAGRARVVGALRSRTDRDRTRVGGSQRRVADAERAASG